MLPPAPLRRTIFISDACTEEVPLYGDQPTTQRWEDEEDGDNYSQATMVQLESKSDFALNPTEFGLILEMFLRGQGVSS